MDSVKERQISVKGQQRGVKGHRRCTKRRQKRVTGDGEKLKGMGFYCFTVCIYMSK